MKRHYTALPWKGFFPISTSTHLHPGTSVSVCMTHDPFPFIISTFRPVIYALALVNMAGQQYVRYGEPAVPYPAPPMSVHQLRWANDRRLVDADRYPLASFPEPEPADVRAGYIRDLALHVHGKAPMHGVQEAYDSHVTSFPDAELARMRNEERDRIAEEYSMARQLPADQQQWLLPRNALIQQLQAASPTWRPIHEEMARRRRVKEDRARMGAVAQLASNTDPDGRLLPTSAAANIIDFLAAPDAVPTRGRVGLGKVPRMRRKGGADYVPARKPGGSIDWKAEKAKHPEWRKMTVTQQLAAQRALGMGPPPSAPKTAAEYAAEDADPNTTMRPGRHQIGPRQWRIVERNPDGSASTQIEDDDWLDSIESNRQALLARAAAARQADRDAASDERDRQRGLIPGTSRGFDNAMGALGKAGFTVLDNTLGKVPVVGSAWKAFAPEGSSLYKQGSVQDKFKNFGKGLASEAVGAVANTFVPGTGMVASKLTDMALAGAGGRKRRRSQLYR